MPRCARALARGGLLLLVFWGGITGVLAQGVLTPPSQSFERPASSYSLTTNATGGIPPLATELLQGPGLFQLGAFDFHPHLLYRAFYGDGIPSGPTNHYRTFIQEISPGLLINGGDHWTLDYTPTERLYANSHFPNSTDELVLLTGKTTYEDWGFNLSQTYSSTTVPLLETEALTEQVNYLTVFQATRQLGGNLSAQFGVNQNIRDISLAASSEEVKEWTASSGLTYQFSSAFGAGVTGLLGYDLITPGSDMKFEQLQGTMNWQHGDKLSLTASAGLEVRQLLGSQLINPVFNGVFTYRPWEQTAGVLSASRTVTPSLYNDEVLVDTTINATLRQRFLEHYTLEVSGSYTTLPFVGFETVNELGNPNDFQIGAEHPELTMHVAQNRTDFSRFITVTLSSTFLEKGKISIFYSYRNTTSEAEAYALTSTQVGIELGWRY